MPVNYRIQDEVLELAFVGDTAPEEIFQTFLDALNDPACPDPTVLLVDVTQSTSLPTESAETIRRVAEFLGPYAERISRRCAMFATDDVHFGLSRMGAVYSEAAGVATRVFRDRNDAIAWLRAGTAS